MVRWPGRTDRNTVKEPYDFHGSDAPHQLLEERGFAVRELPDALSDDLFLIHREAIRRSAFQQAERHSLNSLGLKLSVSPQISHGGTQPRLLFRLNSRPDRASKI